MAATTIDSYADELESYVISGERMDTNLSFSKLRIVPFEVTLASQASGEDIALAIIPRGARLIKGELSASATLSNSAQISIGLAGRDGTGYVDDTTGTIPSYAGGTTTGPLTDSVTCLKAAATQSTTLVGFVLTQALGSLYEAKKDLWLTCTTSVGTVGTEVIKGWILLAYP